MLKALFWASFLLIGYVYVGYPILIYLCSRKKPSHAVKPESTAAKLPLITVIIPAYNEESWIRQKIENTLELDYPRDRLQIVIASDGSTDRTVEIARHFDKSVVRVISFAERLGKQEMLNRLVPQAAGEIVVLTDANALLKRNAVRLLVRHFFDPRVGCVTARRVCILQGQNTASLGEGLYWRYESWIKESESKIHSCLGAQGQLYAVRKAVFPQVAKVGEDFYIPMKIIMSTGLRVLHEPKAVACIPAAANLGIEFERKTRAHVSFLLTLPMLKRLLVPWRSPIWWQFVSHHVLRMLVPPAMFALFLAASALAGSQRFYLLATVGQLVFYALAGIGFLLTRLGRKPKIFYLPFYFVFVNLAVALSWLRWPLGEYDYAWQRTERLPVSG